MNPCFLCDGNRIEALFEVFDFDSGRERFEIVRCRKCGLARTHPALDEGQLARFYQNQYYGTQEAKFNALFEALLVTTNRQRAAQMLRAIGRQHPVSKRDLNSAPRVLDVGCGRGGFVKALGERGAQCWGTELSGFEFPPSPPGVRFLHGELEQLGFESNFFHAVSMWHVLEHMTDPDAALREVARLMRPKGMLQIAIPNFDSLQRKLFERHWFHLDIPRHTHHFSRGPLRALLHKHGFRIEISHTVSLEQNLYGFVQSLLNSAGSNLVPRSVPNELYALIKSSSANQSKPTFSRKAFWTLAGAICVAPAVVENLFSTLAGSGATLIIHARKNS